MFGYIDARGYNWSRTFNYAPINSRLNVVVRSPTPFGLGRNGCWPSRGSQLPILYLLPLPPHHRALLLAIFLRLLPPLLPLTLSGFFNGMLEVSEPGALNYFIFYRPIQSILSASRNPILIHLPLSGFPDFLLCVLIAPTPGLAFSLLMPRTPAAALSFSSDRAYPFPNFLPPLFLCLIPTLIM